MTRILITNDDGIFSEGIKLLAASLSTLAEVFVVAPDGRYATRRTVRLGRRNPEHVEVVDGLKTGEKVVVSGYEAFQKIERLEFGKPDDRNR